MLFVILYFPIKLARLLFHKDKGLLRNNRLLLSVGLFVGVLIWLAMGIFALVEYGIEGVGGAIIFGYLLVVIGWGGIRGHDV